MTEGPALYVGTVRHRRFRPTRHEFKYCVFYAFLDIHSVEEQMRVSRLTSYNRFNLAAFYERDHFGDPSMGLAERVRADADSQGVPRPNGPVFLLTHLRHWGYCFNPISLYFCGGDHPAVMAEVNSTFGERRNYWLGAHNTVDGGGRFRCPKDLHVSPFLPMNLHYEFALSEPAESLTVHIDTLDDQGKVMDATLALRRQTWTAENIRRAVLMEPWMTAKVTAAIHWQALRLWAKGVPVVRNQPKSGDAL